MFCLALELREVSHKEGDESLGGIGREDMGRNGPASVEWRKFLTRPEDDEDDVWTQAHL